MTSIKKTIVVKIAAMTVIASVSAEQARSLREGRESMASERRKARNARPHAFVCEINELLQI